MKALKKTILNDAPIMHPEAQLSSAESRFVSSLLTFPVLGALGVMLGIVLERLGLPFLTVLSAFAAFVLCGLQLRTEQRISLRAAWLVLFVLLVVPIAHLRSSIVERTPDYFMGLDGQVAQLEGQYDGRFLNTTHGRLVVTPKLTTGFWRVEGTFEPVAWTRNFGSFDYGAWLARRGVQHTFKMTKSLQLNRFNPLELVRTHFKNGVTAGLGVREAAFMTSLVLGWTDDFSNLPEFEVGSASTSWRDAFSRSGLAHILALSGQQVALLLIALGFVLSPFGVRRYPILIVFLMLYVWVVGPSPSVIRAALMGVAAIIALWLGRGRLEIMPMLGLSAMLTLLAGPRWIADLGWQLSHLAVLGLAVFMPFVTRFVDDFKPFSAPQVSDLHTSAMQASWVQIWCWKFLSFMVLTFATTLAAQVMTLPLAASSFGIVPLGSPIANLIAAPLVTVLVPLGFLAAVLGGALGAVVNALVQPLAFLTLETARVFSDFPIIPFQTVFLLGYTVYFASLTVLLLAAFKRIRWNTAFAVVICMIVTTFATNLKPHAEIIYLDVGQGDSTLIRLPTGDILLDGGGSVRSDFDTGARVIVPALRALGVQCLLAVIATHADTDHIEGLGRVFEQFPVGTLIVGHNKNPGVDPIWDALIQNATLHNVPIQSVRRGQRWTLGRAHIEFLNPTWIPSSQDNLNSVAFTLDYTNNLGQHQRSLFLGDASSDVESGIHAGHLNVLKLAHHGSRFSSSNTLLNSTRPQSAIISSGTRNSYGHPALDVLKRLTAYQVTVYRTDRDGAVRYDLETGVVTVAAPNAHTGEVGQPGQLKRRVNSKFVKRVSTNRILK